LNVGFGQPRAGWEPVVGCWTPAEDEAGVASSLDAAAVDQLDLAAIAAQELA
jgi:hypothetical protein